MTGFTIRVKTLDVPGRPVEFADKDIAAATNDELREFFGNLAVRGQFEQLTKWAYTLAACVRDLSTAKPEESCPQPPTG